METVIYETSIEMNRGYQSYWTKSRLPISQYVLKLKSYDKTEGHAPSVLKYNSPLIFSYLHYLYALRKRLTHIILREYHAASKPAKVTA